MLNRLWHLPHKSSDCYHSPRAVQLTWFAKLFSLTYLMNWNCKKNVERNQINGKYVLLRNQQQFFFALQKNFFLPWLESDLQSNNRWGDLYFWLKTNKPVATVLFQRLTVFSTEFRKPVLLFSKINNQNIFLQYN